MFKRVLRAIGSALLVVVVIVANMAAMAVFGYWYWLTT